jgi:hypothetical protein
MLEEMTLKCGAIMTTLGEEDVTIKVDQLHIPEDADQLRADFIRPAYYWVGSLYETEYAEVKRIKDMQTAEMWARYKKWGGFEDYREVLLLNAALSELRAKIVSRSRPDFFKKSKRNAKKNKIKAGVSTSEGVES